MLHFNNLMYYSLPRLPKNWKPPTWLTIELGIFAGRLYFEFGEYAALANYLGLADLDNAGSIATDVVEANGIRDKGGERQGSKSGTSRKNRSIFYRSGSLSNGRGRILYILYTRQWGICVREES